MPEGVPNSQTSVRDLIFRLCVLTLAHWIPLPSTARSHTCAKANDAPAVHDRRFESVLPSSDRAPVLAAVYMQINSHATALVISECVAEVATLARTDDVRKAKASAVGNGTAAWCSDDANGNSMREMKSTGCSSSTVLCRARLQTRKAAARLDSGFMLLHASCAGDAQGTRNSCLLQRQTIWRTPSRVPSCATRDADSRTHLVASISAVCIDNKKSKTRLNVRWRRIGIC